MFGRTGRGEGAGRKPTGASRAPPSTAPGRTGARGQGSGGHRGPRLARSPPERPRTAPGRGVTDGVTPTKDVLWLQVAPACVTRPQLPSRG